LNGSNLLIGLARPSKSIVSRRTERKRFFHFERLAASEYSAYLERVRHFRMADSSNLENGLRERRNPRITDEQVRN